MKKLTQKFDLTKQPISYIVSLLICSSACFLIACTTADSANSTQTIHSPLTTKIHEKVSSNQYNLGEKAPNFTLQDLEGTTRSLSNLKGKFVVIHFATTWCPFCNAEAPYLEQIYQDYQDQGVEVFIIDVKEDPKLVQEKLQDRFHFNFPILLDHDGKVAAAYAPEGVLPDLARDEVSLASNLLIDTEGKIQFFSLLDSKDFDAELIALKKRLHELL